LGSAAIVLGERNEKILRRTGHLLKGDGVEPKVEKIEA